MLKKIGITALVIIPLLVIAVLGITNNSANNSNPPAKIKIENFTLTDIYDKKHSLSDYNEAKVILVLFIATQCPVSNAYNTRMVELYNSYKDKDVAVIGINSNKQESMNECRQHAEQNGFKFPVLKDDKNVIADMFEATVTPEAYLLEPGTYKILYHGRIDDSRNENNVEQKDLQNAINEVLAGKKVSNTKTKAFGCTIKRV